MSLSFKDRVVIITGAGGGLGKVYALEYAKRGAKVVVNDLGVSLAGEGHNNRAADVVVEEIKGLGGTAIANYDSVTEGEKIVQAAIDAFGRVDVLVNNAANLRDGTFAKMSEDDFKAVIEVHLTGTYKLSKAAWPYMRKQGYGRILNTASPAGLYGNFGQTNYSAAKLGQVGLAETLAKEGSKYNIKVNVIAPLARSRMTEGLLPYHILKVMGPEKVAPMVLYLTHESVPISGKIFEPAAGYFGQVRWERSSGELFNVDDSFTAEAILEKFKGITSFQDKDFKPVEHPEHLADYNDLITKARRLPPNVQGNVKIRSLKDKVVIITGAGGGLGKSHALWFAKYGAKVVVNDIRNSEEVVREINNLYGANRAVADTHDIVTQGSAIVATAINAFGTVDILINNAGILRDRSFAKMTDDEWNAVLNVHLYSVFGLCKAVWPIFAKKKSGIIVNTTSTSGIYGNFGQANYAAAKAAVLGFSRSLALEGQRAGIKVFIIAPHAETAMTKTIFSTRELTNHFEPGLVSPFVVLLASAELNSRFRCLNGSLFEVGGGWIGNTRWQRSKAVISHGNVTPEFVRDHWKDITDFSSNTTNPSKIDEASSYILKTVGTAAGMGTMNSKAKYTHREVILYNIGVGATARELKYTYEHHPDFQVLPTFPIVLAMNGGTFEFGDLVENFDFTMLLHGEQYIKIMQHPIPTEANIKVETRPVAAINKGSNAALIVIGYDVINMDTNTKIAYSEGSYFVRGAKVKSESLARGFATRPKFAGLPFNAPSTAPDYEATVATDKNQAVLYRLSGDYNPLHVDSLVAKMAGFPKPILHGLASLGFCAKQLVDKYGAFDELKVRFSDFVFPGDRLKLHSWKQSNGVVVFNATDVDRDRVVLSNAAIKLIGSSAKL